MFLNFHYLFKNIQKSFENGTTLTIYNGKGNRINQLLDRVFYEE